jgi:hypothetical protein
MSEDIPIKPTPDQLEEALNLARALRERGRDPDFLGHALLYCEHRVEVLERVRLAAERYLHSGMAEHEHSDLVRALAAARRTEPATTHEQPGRFGLD